MPTYAVLDRSDFCIAISGWKPVCGLIRKLLSPPLSTRTLHVMGRNDVIIPEEHTGLLVNACSNRRIEYHEGGT